MARGVVWRRAPAARSHAREALATMPIVTLVIGLAIAWGSAALWFDGPAPRWLAGSLAAAYAVVSAALLISIEPPGLAALAALAPFAVVLGWWLAIPPHNDRDWSGDAARLATATIEGTRVTIENLRDFDYRSRRDYTERWETRGYDLEKLVGIDLFIAYWGPTLYAHTIASWEFSDGEHLAISIETRRRQGERYSALRGFFRQFELYYAVSTERDAIGVRVNHRGERVYLYRVRASAETARALLLDYLDGINRLAREPRWYNALTLNCTSAIRYHANNIAADNPWSWKLLANGYIDELGYARGQVNTSLPFAEIRRRSDITEKARRAGGDPGFSRLIREGLPERPQ